MPFRAKKLRVQLPCSVEGSLLEFADNGAPEPGERAVLFEPFTCYLTMLDYCHCSVVPEILAEKPHRLVEPDLLPLLKKHLENRLAELELVAEVVKKRMKAQLDDIAVAEQALRDRQSRDQDQEPGE
jgi:hypothetical protein